MPNENLNHKWVKNKKIADLIWIWKCSDCGMESVNLENEQEPSHVSDGDHWNKDLKHIFMTCEEFAIKDILT
jgi:hypothetical protein